MVNSDVRRVSIATLILAILFLGGCEWLFGDSCEEQKRKGDLDCNKNPNSNCCHQKKTTGTQSDKFVYAVTHICESDEGYADRRINRIGRSELSCADAKDEYKAELKGYDICLQNGPGAPVHHGYSTSRVVTYDLAGRCNR